MHPIQNSAGLGRRHCHCKHAGERPRLIVLTGGPGAGKTAVLNLARQRFCQHVRVLEESASILFGGGFPREKTQQGRRAAQRAIYHIQRELEGLAASGGACPVVLCDRGTLDGLAYWPGARQRYFDELGTSLEEELSHYDTVLQLRTPPATQYTHENALRIESAAQAHTIDNRIFEIWSQHPHRHVINSDEDFLDKARRALAIIAEHVPVCCQHGRVPP